MKVIIDPSDNILYKSFYIYGLEQLFGRSSIIYSTEPFRGLSKQSRNTKSIRFVIDEASRSKKYVIACNDSFQIIPELYDWCDIYGSVNANFGLTPIEYHQKLVSLCPSFAIRCWSIPQTGIRVVSGIREKDSTLRKHLGMHKRLLQRNPYTKYEKKSESKDNYIFTCSTLWNNDEWNKNDEGVNLSRAFFIRAVRSCEDIFFEGGLVPSERSTKGLFDDCYYQGCSTKDWLEKTKQSFCVFNTPAYWNCHGWKLGEYMAMGKAIISTPLSNDLPVPLVDGEHYLVVENNQESMREAVERIRIDSHLRQKLESNIRAYWKQYGSPEASLRLLGIEK